MRSTFKGTFAFHVLKATDKFERWIPSAFLPPPEFCVGNWGIGSAPRRKIECIGKFISNYRIAKVTPTLIAITKKPNSSLGSIVCWSPGQLPQEDGSSPSHRSPVPITLDDNPSKAAGIPLLEISGWREPCAGLTRGECGMPGSAKERSVLLLPLEARGGMPAVLGRHEVAVSNSGRRRLQPWGGEGLRGRPMVRVPNPSLGWLD